MKNINISNIFEKGVARKIIGGILACALFALMVIFDGNNSIKHLLFGLAMSVGCGVLLNLKKFKLLPSIITFVSYLVYVPYKLFIRMELPVDNLANMQKRSMLVSIAMMLVVYLAFFVFTQRIRIALAAGNIVFFIIMVLDFYVISFRGQAASFADARTVGTMFTVWGNYDYTPSGELIYSLLYFVFFTLLALKLDISPTSIKEKHPKYPVKKVHIIGSILGTLAVAAFFVIIVGTTFLEDHGMDDSKWRDAKLHSVHGIILYPFVEYRSSQMHVPFGYSEAKVEEICNDAADNFVSEKAVSEKRPTVILIMNEAFSDPRVLGEVETNEPIMPFIDSLSYDQDAVRGNLYMSVLGALTVNSEFEVLSGNTMRFLPGSLIPYLSEINSYMPTMVEEMETIGYDTVAMHPNAAHAYCRKNVYECFGFNEFITIDEMAPLPEEANSVFLDKYNYDEIIKRYENRDKSKPLFLFDVTIQNHSPYWDEGRTTRITKIGNTEEGIDSQFIPEETYIDLLRKSDEAFKNLVEYFENVDEPVVICMFGDHQAILSDAFYNLAFDGQNLSEQEKTQKKYIVPYIMWSNYDADFYDPGDMSANYLSAVLMEELGLPMSDYRKFLLNTKEKYPIFSRYQLNDASGAEVDSETEKADEDILHYKYMQYNLMYSGKTVESVFEPKDNEQDSALTESTLRDWKEYGTICHALGKVGNVTLTNSLEAFETNYRKGYRVFEADFQITSDNVYVLRHDWSSDLGQAEGFGWTEDVKEVPTAEEFKKTPIYEYCTPLLLEDWLQIMKEYPDIWLVTDSKYSNTVTEDFQLFVETARNCGCEDVLDRVIVQLYYQDMYDEVNAVYPFKNYIFTLYMIGFPEDSEELLRFMEEKNIGGLTMPSTTWNESIKETLGDHENFKVYVHTVNDRDEAVRFLENVDGIYTDMLREETVEAIKSKKNQ